MGIRIEFYEMAARRKLVASGKDLPSSWSTYRWEHLQTGLVRVDGSASRILTKGKNKGQKTWDGPTLSAYVTDAEAEAEKAIYARETGNCPECLGSGREFVRWSAANGTETKVCPHCDGTGKTATEAHP